MNFTLEKLKEARDAGISDDVIWEVASKENPKFSKLKENNIPIDVAFEAFQRISTPEPEPIEERGIARAAGDVGVAFTQGGVRGFRSLTDVFGADNPASTTLRGVEDYVGNLLSAQAKKDQGEVSRILTEAQDKGIYDQLIAGVKAFATAPVLTTAGAAGSIAVNLLGGITANAASLGIRGIALGARGMMASQAAIGAAQGAGIIKGEIYDATEKYLLEQGMSPEIAKKGASEAQSYGGKNLDSILLGTGLGAAAAMTGVEKVARNVILRQGGIPTTKAITRFVTGTLEEMVPEAAQAGQGQLAKNLALQREGADVPTMRGVVGSAALEGLAGGALGGPTSLLFDKPRGDTPIIKPKGKTPQIIEEEEIDSTSDQVADELEKEPTSPATEMAMKRMQFQSQIDNLTTEIEEDELLLQTIEQTSPDRQRAELALSGKKTALANIISEFNTIPKEELSETITPAAATATPTDTKETTIAKIDELNKEFDALDENDQVGIDRVNKAIAVEQNKLAELTAIEQGVEPQGTTPTREMGLPPSGRRSEFGTFFPDRPVLQAFVKATDKVLGGIKTTSKRAQKLKNAIRTGITSNAGFLAGTNTEVISSEEYGKLTGGKQVAADTGTYRATFFNGKKYLVVPDVNQLAGISIQGEQRAASRDAALDQESRAAAKKLEEEVIHLSMFQGIQDEYKALKKPKFSEQEYIVKRISDIAKEVKQTNPNALPGVSEVYLNEKNKNLDDMTFSQEFMRMVIQRVRTGQITEDLNAIRKAEQEAFSDQDKGLITAWKNSILNALEFVRNSIARYLGKGTSTKEVKRMEDAINNILDEYGIVKGEANYEFKDYSTTQPKGELKAEPTEEVAAVTPTKEVRNIEEASQETGVSKEAILTAAQNGEIEAAKVGNNWRFGQRGIDEIKSKLSETITPAIDNSPNTEVESEVAEIENLSDDATYEQIEEAAPATMVNLKASTKNVAGSFQQFSKILGDSFKSLVRFAQTIWKKIGKLTVVATGISVIASAPIVVEYQNLKGPEGRADLRPTGLIKKNANLFKPYFKKTTIEQLSKSLETPAETLDLIRNAINQAKPYNGKLDIDFNSIDTFANSINPEEFASGNTKRSYNYNFLLEISADDVKNAAQSLKTLAKDKAKIESRIRQVMGAMEFFTKRKFNDVKIIVRQTSPSEAATFMALGKAGGFPTSRAQYNPKENTIELQPQTLISLAEDGIVATSSASNLANELTHNLQYTTNNGKPLGILYIKLSDFDTASTFLTMQMPVYSQNGKLFQTINAESNWADILIGKYFGAKNNIRPKSIESVLAEQPKMQKAFQEKETTDFVDSIGYMSGMSSQEIIARAGTTPAIEAKAGITPQMDTDYLAAVERGDSGSDNLIQLLRDAPQGERNAVVDAWVKRNPVAAETAQRMADEAAKKAGYDTKAIHGTPTKERIDVFGRRGELTGMRSAQKAFFFSDSQDVANTYRFQNRAAPNESIVNQWIDSLSDDQVSKIIPPEWGISKDDADWMRYSAKKEALNFTNEIGEDIYYAIDDLIDYAKLNNIPYPAELDQEIIGQTIPVFLNIKNPYRFTYDEFEADGINEIVDRAIDGGFDGGISSERIPDAYAGSDNRNPPSGIIKFVFNPEQIKSADPVTYDDAGNVIPLSQRFDVTSPIIARAGVTPEGEPMSKRGQTVMQKITSRMISDLEAQVEMLKPKKNKAYTEYKSRTTKKGKTYNQALISPFSLAANLFTSNSFTEANNALNKIVRGNPDADFFDIAQGLAGTDAAEAQRRYGIDQNERFVLMEMIYQLLPAFRKEVDDSSMKATARDSFRLDALNVEAKLAQNITLAAQSGGQIVGYARVLRKLVGAGMAILTYKRGIIDSMGSLAKATNASFNDVANAIRGDRRKSMDQVFNTKEVFKKAVSMIKMAQRNPEKVRQAIRAEVSKKQNLKTTDILLQFASGLFDTKEDKYANMVLDQTVQNILSIGMNKKEFSIDNVTKFMYQSFATAAKQLGIEQAGVEKPKRGKRSGKYMEMVKAVIGNDNAYKSFLNDLASRMAEKYQSRDAFNADFAELFTALRSNEWADGLREQAIKDTAQFLNYKFADLFTYLGSQRNVNQEAVKQHIRSELQGTGASNELIEKFIQDTDKYLNEETSRILQDKLGFRIDEKTGKVIPKPLLSSKIKEEAEEQFKAIKNLKDISKLSTSDEGKFIEALISRIITEVGMDKEQATELATLISTQMEKAMLAQRSENVDRAIKDAQEILNSNGVKPKTNQRTVLQKLIEMANMGVLDAEGVYEAFRKTHDFPKGFLPYDADFTNTLREWGDRISKLPPGVIRSIEEEKMGRALMEKSKFTTGDILSSYWYFSLLSQVATQGINALSGASNLMANVAVWSLYKPKSFFPMMRAMYHAIEGRKSPAVNSFLYVMRNGLNPSGMQDEKRAKYPKTNVLESATPENTPKIVYYLTNFGDGKINFLPDWMNTALKNVNPRQLMRVLRATDMFLREVAYEAKAAQIGAADFSREGFDMAKRQAESELFSSDATGKQKEQEIIIRANEIYREQRLDETGRAIAEQASLETAFNQQPVGLFGLLANFVNSLLGKYPATKFIIPFTNVVANVTNEFINYTPFFSQIRLIGSKRRGVNDPFTQGSAEKQMEMQIKGFIGFAAMFVPFIIQALTGGDEEDQEERPYIQFYAEGPKDPRQKKIWQQRGGQKYSVRVGNTYFSYLPTPLVIPLAMGAMLQQEIKSMNKKGEKVQSEDIGKLAASVLTAPFSVGFVAVLNQSFLTGLADLLEFKESQNPVEKGTQVVGGILSRMAVPGIFRDINKLYTEDKAIGGDYLSNFLKDFPGSVNFLNKDVNYFGDDAKFPSAVREEGFGRRLASVVGRIVSTEQPDPAFEVMYRNNLTPPSWDASLSWDNGKRMTKEQELQFIREAGPLMRERIVEVSDELDELPIDEAQDLLSTEIRIIRREVKEDLQDRLEIPLDIE